MTSGPDLSALDLTKVAATRAHARRTRRRFTGGHFWGSLMPVNKPATPCGKMALSG